MYRKMAEEGDNKMAERWQKDAEGILIFVRTAVIFFTPVHTPCQHYRRVCSLPPLRRYFR
jgi:hypothetical protein